MRTHMTPLALALAVGLLTTSYGTTSARAQTLGAAQNRYQARIPGGHVSFLGSSRSRGLLGYSYGVQFPDVSTSGSGWYVVIAGYPSPAAALADNAAMFRAERRAQAGGWSAHKAGVWLVQQVGNDCSFVAGTTWHRLAFVVSATGYDCVPVFASLTAEFAGVSAAVGRHSPARLPWPPQGAPVFGVRAWFEPDLLTNNESPTLFARSLPGARCSAAVLSAAGRSSASLDGVPQTIGPSGLARWRWHEEGEIRGDRASWVGGRATVDCTYHGRHRRARATFWVM